MAPTNDWVGPLWLVSASLLLYPKQKGTTAESSQVWTSTRLVSNIILQPTVQGVPVAETIVAMWRWLTRPSTRTTVWGSGHCEHSPLLAIPASRWPPRQPQSWCPWSGAPTWLLVQREPASLVGLVKAWVETGSWAAPASKEPTGRCQRRKSPSRLRFRLGRPPLQAQLSFIVYKLGRTQSNFCLWVMSMDNYHIRNQNWRIL